MNRQTAADVMTSPVLTVQADWELEHLASFFVEKNISGAPVTDASGEVIGVVSMTDIVRHNSVPVQEGPPEDTHEYYLASSGRQYTDEEMYGFQIQTASGVTTRDLMTPMVFRVAEDASVQEMAGMMVSGGIHRILVSGDRPVVGIVTALDLLKVLRDI